MESKITEYVVFLIEILLHKYNLQQTEVISVFFYLLLLLTNYENI